MKLGARLRGFSDEELIEGGEPAEREARDKLRRDQRVRIAMMSGKPELPRSELVPARLPSRSVLEHTPSGEFFAPTSAEQNGTEHDSFDAFLIERSGDVTFLQRPQSGAQSRAELEAHRNSRAAS